MVTREEFEQLRQLVLSLIAREDRRAMYDQADKGGIRQTESQYGEALTEHTESIEQNSADIDFVAMETGVEL